MKVNILLITYAILSCSIAMAQTVTIKGTVSNSINSDLLQGVAVRSGTGSSTRSDNKGYFEITLPANSHSILFSHIGYENREIKMPKDAGVFLKVVLQEKNNLLEEVKINTGYQSLPRERMTGSFSQIDKARFNEQVGSHVLDRLPAIANSYGVTSARTNPNGYTSIRGFSTLTGPRNPLIVVDNFPYEGDIDNFNPNDVENITFLKDAAAASIWGTRAGNGVIVITTKKGKRSMPTNITLSSNISILEKPDLFKIRMISSADYIDMEKDLFNNKHRFSDTANMGRPSFTPLYEILFKEKKQMISEGDASRQMDALRGLDVRDDYLRYLYRTGFNRQYAINANGGTNSVAWLLSAGHDKNAGLSDEGYKRMTLRSNNTYYINERMDISIGAFYTQTTNLSGRPTYNSITNGTLVLPPYTRMVGNNGEQLPIYKRRQEYVDTAGDGKLLDWKYYPLEDYQYSTVTANVRNLLANFGFQYKIGQGLVMELKYQHEWQNLKREVWQGEQSYYTRDLINNFTQINTATGAVVYKVPLGDIMDLTDVDMQAYNFRGQLNYSKHFGDHNFFALAGSEMREKKDNSATHRTYGLNKDILTIVPVDYANTYPQYLTGFNSFIPNTANFEGTNTRYLSMFGNFSYTYKSRYTISGSARRDASNTFGIATNDKWTPLWSAGLGWDIAAERFYSLSFVSYLKLRGTYGFSGNVDPSRTAMTTIKYSSTSPYTLSPITDVERFYNPSLRWEKVRMTNIGLDFKLAGNRVSGSLEYFQKKATDLYGPVSLDMTVGLRTATITKNVAVLAGNGVDVEVSSENLKGAVKWETQLNFSWYSDKVMKHYTPTYVGNNFVGGGMFAVEGKPLYSLFAYQWHGLNPENGNPIGFINGHQSESYMAITGDSTQLSDLVYKGSLIPLEYGSVGNTVRWKGLSLTARVSFAFGHYFRKQSIDYSGLVSSGVGHSDFGFRWQKKGDEEHTNIPSWIYPLNNNRDMFYKYAEVLTARADNIRLQYISLDYVLPEKTVARMGCSLVRFFCTASNLGLLWRKNTDGIDPDYPETDIQPSRTFSLGVNIGF
ncbi:SusC/RagA family TonB-linked outer membrane protein [Sphingobacterium paucimobilis]|uniref:TonB-dependent receptor plug domain-containing protein n=1 Tax=Sphingobacterium paucimobilis HER1398 TaxID=1346330 RepID=U2H891_9SPHI|nr:SusC/RagA family TonB-linked outer membrane protein [Sphingobacterium paucimobilis]ERJ57936.1 hypothetical protein M472_04070 [Sphingobacterium paucimobilis HER1398]